MAFLGHVMQLRGTSDERCIGQQAIMFYRRAPTGPVTYFFSNTSFPIMLIAHISRKVSESLVDLQSILLSRS